MDELTEKQLRILDCIRAYRDEHGYAPGIRDIGERLGLALHGVHQHLGRLERKGVIRRTPGVARSIVVVEQPREQ